MGNAPQVTFGPGDYGGYNNYAFSGANSFWTNWYGGFISTGQFGRIIALAARWDAYCGFCSSTIGHNDMWVSGSGSRGAVTGDYSVGCQNAGSAETMHNAGISDYWQNNGSYAIGFWRHAGDCSIIGGQTNWGSGYCGASSDDVTLPGCSSAWGGGGNFGLPVYGTLVQTQVWVRRSGGWNQTYVYTRRSGGWSGPMIAWVMRSGSWNYQNAAPIEIFMQKSERHIPARGLPVKLWTPEHGAEDAVLTEEGYGWFGSFDPSVYPGFDFWKPQHYRDLPRDLTFTGRFSSADNDQAADRRLYAQDQYQRALKRGDVEEAETWKTNWMTPGPALAPERMKVPTPSWLTHTRQTKASMPSRSPRPTSLSGRSITLSDAGARPYSARTRAFSSSGSASASPTLTSGVRSAASGLSSVRNCGCPDLYDWERAAMKTMPAERLPLVNA